MFSFYKGITSVHVSISIDTVSHKQALEKKNSLLIIGTESKEHSDKLQLASSKHFVLDRAELLPPST